MEDFRIIDKIGAGFFAEVFKVRIIQLVFVLVCEIAFGLLLRLWHVYFNLLACA